MDEISQLIASMDALPLQDIELAGGIVSDDIKQVNEKEFSLISSAGVKRQREFLCGRHYAHQILDSMGYSGYVISRDEHGCPAWPDGIMGSISHTNNYCVVAIAADESRTSVGIDLEESGRMKQSLWGRLFTQSEISQLKSIDQPIEQMRQAAIMFSAKEAFYKYDYPLNQRQYDFTDVEVTLSGVPHQLCLHISGTGRPAELTGYFVSGLTHVMTIVAG
jgi:4'-phosphopantetheinyl transferase EntD